MPARPEAARAERRRAVDRVADRVCGATNVGRGDGRLGHGAIVDDCPGPADRRYRQTVPMDDEPARLPLRLVVTDDLERSRVTVFFRLLLAIPHLVVVSLWGLAAAAVSVILWLALVFEGKAPRSLQSFVASYLRYSVHVSAYIYLAAGPYPPFGGGAGYSVDLEIDLSPRQSRGRVAARLVLAVPALVIASVLGGGVWFGNTSWFASRNSDSGFSAGATIAGIAVTAAFLAWFASVARGRTPRGLRDLIAYTIGYSAQATGYLLLLTDRYPTSDPSRVLPEMSLPPHPVRLELDDPLDRSRLTVFFRLLLAIPHLIWLALWYVLVLLAVIVAWIAALVTGRVPVALHRFIAAYVRYVTHVLAFLFLDRRPVPRLRRRSRKLSRQPRDRSPRAAAPDRHLLPGPTCRSRADPRRRLPGSGHSRRRARLVGGAVHRSDARGPA